MNRAATVLMLASALGGQQTVQWVRQCDGNSCRLVPVRMLVQPTAHADVIHDAEIIDSVLPVGEAAGVPTLAPAAVYYRSAPCGASYETTTTTTVQYRERPAFAERRPLIVGTARVMRGAVRVAVRAPLRIMGRIVFGRRGCG